MVLILILILQSLLICGRIAMYLLHYTCKWHKMVRKVIIFGRYNTLISENLVCILTPFILRVADESLETLKKKFLFGI